MSRYPLNLPGQLKKEAEHWADKQGVSLNQFIMWSVAEKIGALRQMLDDPNFPQITYKRGSSGTPTPVLFNTGIRVQTLIIASQSWGMGPKEIAQEYDLSMHQVKQAFAFYEVHQEEIDAAIAIEKHLETANV